MRALLATALLFGTTVAVPSTAQVLNVDAGRAITVQPAQTPLSVSLSLNRAGTAPSYRPGESIAITVSTNRDAYIYLYSVEATGAIQRIAPNTFENNHILLRGGTSRRFPEANSPYQFTISPPYGQASVFAVASEQPLTNQELSSFSFLTTLPTANTTNRAITVAPSQTRTVTTTQQRYWVSY